MGRRAVSRRKKNNCEAEGVTSNKNFNLKIYWNKFKNHRMFPYRTFRRISCFESQIVLEQKESRTRKSFTIGMMNYLQQSTRLDLAFAVHQCARFCNNPKQSHERAVKCIRKYLLGTKGRGITCRPDKNKDLECYVDTDFAESWDSGDPDNPENVMPRTGYII